MSLLMTWPIALMIFGDIPSGQIFYVDADHLPAGGNSTIRRILLNDGGTPKTLMQVIGDRRQARGGSAAFRATFASASAPTATSSC